MERTAHCCCGSLRVEAAGDPDLVVACHCRQCQRRTGAPFGVSAYFDRARLRIAGPSKLYTRAGQEGRKVRLHFCPECGSTVYWEADIRPGQVGVALGAFADPQFPDPAWSIWEESRHPWVAFGHELGHFPQALSPAR